MKIKFLLLSAFVWKFLTKKVPKQPQVQIINDKEDVKFVRLVYKRKKRFANYATKLEIGQIWSFTPHKNFNLVDLIVLDKDKKPKTVVKKMDTEKCDFARKYTISLQNVPDGTVLASYLCKNK